MSRSSVLLPTRKVHVVTSDAILARPGFLDVATAVLQSSRDSAALHIRGSATPAARLFEIVTTIQRQLPDSGLVVNDRIDIALGAGVPAVHVGSRGLPVARIRSMAAALVIGYSAHAAGEAATAEADGADFIFAGTIYASVSHPGRSSAGLELIRETVAVCNVPVIAIGGVTKDRIRELRDAGARGVAVISAVWDAPDPVVAVQELLETFKT